MVFIFFEVSRKSSVVSVPVVDNVDRAVLRTTAVMNAPCIIIIIIIHNREDKTPFA